MACSMKKLNRLIMLAVYATSAQAKEQDLIVFLMKQGLAIDAPHAFQLAADWQLYRQNEKSKRDKEYADKSSLGEARKMLRNLFPGMVNQFRGKSRLVSGDIIKLKAAGHWVTSQYSSNMKLFRKRGLYVSDKSTRNDAVEIRLSVVGRNPGAVILYGDLLLLETPFTSMRVRLFSPGNFGPVTCSSHFFMVEVDNNGALAKTYMLGWQEKLGGGGFPVYGNTMTRENGVSPLCFTCHFADESREKPRLCRKPTTKVDVTIVAYNAWMIPRLGGILKALQTFGLGISFRKDARASMIPEAIVRALVEKKILKTFDASPDVFVLCEAFCDRGVKQLKAGLKHALGLAFETTLGGAGSILDTRAFLNSGVTLLSRYPILSSKFKKYSTACGNDKWANKGAVYVKLLKNGLPVHVVATHLQAWDYDQAVKTREAQFVDMKSFIEELHIPPYEPLIFAGDLNVCRVRSPGEYDRMLEILNANDTHDVDLEVMSLARKLVETQESELSEDKTQKALIKDSRLHRIFTFNAVRNTLARGPCADETCGILDYVLYSKECLGPTSSRGAVLDNLRGDFPYDFQGNQHTDLSDHYPVVANFTFEFQQTPRPETPQQ